MGNNVRIDVDRKHGLVKFTKKWDYNEGDPHRALRRAGQRQCYLGVMEWITEKELDDEDLRRQDEEDFYDSLSDSYRWSLFESPGDYDWGYDPFSEEDRWMFEDDWATY